MSGVPQADSNKRKWLSGWFDGVNQRKGLATSRPPEGRDFYEEGRRAGAIALDRAHKEAADLFGMEPDGLRDEKP
jgi:hypothetical protein